MINVYNNDKYTKLLTTTLNYALSRFDLNSEDIDIEIDFLEKAEMQLLNKEEREIDEVTDVLSFPNIDIKFPFSKNDYPLDIDPDTGNIILGDIYLCMDKAEEQAKEYNHSSSREVAFLALHGLLHLLGNDHIEDGEREKMEKIQEDILTSLNINRDLSDEEILKAVEIKSTDDNASVEKILEKPSTVNPNFKSGFVAIVGRPNAGKSTLVNALVGEKVSIVSWKPQTTRDKILGIITNDDSQIVLIDTPGLHAPKNQLGNFMMKNVTKGLEDADGIVYMVDGEKGLDEIDTVHISKYLKNSYKVIVAVNKTDHITVAKLGEILKKINEIENLSAVIPISALRGKNLKILLKEMRKLLTRKEKFFDDELYTDKNMRFIAAEIIREKTLRLLDKEIPYGVGVAINKYEYNENGVLIIDAEIICEKKAHKPIILGKNGDMIKKISTYARQDLEKITGSKIYITTWVRVKEDWREDSSILDLLGYANK